MKNKSYIGISFVILIFGIYAIPKIVNRFKNNEIVKGTRLDKISNKQIISDLLIVGKVPKFKLIDQNERSISDQSYLGKVYVVEFFFTSCPTICPKMNANMIEIQNNFFGNPNFGIASISIDPKNDTAAVLKNHAKVLGATATNWHFLTGDETNIMDLSYKGFNLYVGKNPKIAGGFEHSGLFALIDKKGNIRCRKDKFNNPIIYYDGLQKEGIKALMNDIKLLLEE